MPPSAAERARTALAHAPVTSVEIGSDLVVAVDVLVPDHDGSLVLLVDADGELAERVAAGPVPAAVHAALLSPVPGPDRLLDVVTVHGPIALADDVREALEVVLVACSDQAAETVLRPDASALLRMSVLPAAMRELQHRAAQVRTCPFDGTPHGPVAADP